MRIFLSLTLVCVFAGVCRPESPIDLPKLVARGRTFADQQRANLVNEVATLETQIKDLPRYQVTRKPGDPSYHSDTRIWYFSDRQSQQAHSKKLKDQLRDMKRDLLNYPSWQMPIVLAGEAELGDVGLLMVKPPASNYQWVAPRTSRTAMQGSVQAAQQAAASSRNAELNNPAAIDVEAEVVELLGAGEFLAPIGNAPFILTGWSPVQLGQKLKLNMPLAVVDKKTRSTGTHLVLRQLRPAELQQIQAETNKLPQRNQPRTWSDVTGQHKIDAALVDLVDGVAHLRKSNGEIAKVPLNKLGREERKSIEEQLGDK